MEKKKAIPKKATQSRYGKRGVSSDKNDVHNAIKHLYPGLYPKAFCKILPDVLGKNKNYCNIMHADGAGTKSALAYIYWKLTRDLSVWKGIAQDAMIMNLDDMICAGAGLQNEEFLYSLSIDRNQKLIPGEVISAIIEGTQELMDEFSKFGIKIHFAGGETADVGDLVRTITVNATMSVRMKRSNVIVPKLLPKSVIVGLSSTGQSIYESDYNSGIGSNGLTSARHDVFNKSVGEEYPDSFNPLVDPKLIYCGKHKLDEKVLIDGYEPIDMAKFILSPTRTYAPILKALFQQSVKKNIRIDGIIHCSGGGQTKVGRFIPKNVIVVKDNLFPIPPLFAMNQKD